MSEGTPILVRGFTGGPFDVSAEDGQRLPDARAPILKEGKSVVLSFAGIETIIAACLGAVMGRLHGEMASEDVDALLSTRRLDEDDREMLQRVRRNSKRYYENPGASEAAWKEAEGTCDLAMIEAIED